MKKRLSKNKAGLTLIEMIMAIAIFSIGIFGFTMLFAKTWKTNSYTIEMGQANMKVSQGMNKIVDYIRGAQQGDDGSYAVQLADDDSLVFFSDYDKDGIVERLHMYKNGENILMGITNPTITLPKTYPANDQQIITLVTNIVNDASTPIFYYYNENYPSDVVNNPVSTPALPADVRLMKVYLKINTVPGHTADDTEMQSFVEMRNLNDYDRI